MIFNIRKVCYFNTTVEDRPGEAYKLLSALADIGVNLLAFTAIPIGSNHSRNPPWGSSVGDSSSASRPSLILSKIWSAGFADLVA